MKICRLLFLALIVALTTGNTSNAQVSFGLGVAGLKYLGNGSVRPIAGGLNANLSIEFSEKTKLLLTPTIYLPVTYTYIDSFKNIPNVKTDEQFKTVQATALFVMNVIGNNKDGAFY